MPLAELDGSIIRVKSEYHERQLMREISGARYDKDTSTWTIPLTWASCIVMRGVFGTLLTVGPELTKWAWEEHKLRIGPALELREAMKLPPDSRLATALNSIENESGGVLKLNPYQRADVAFMVTARKCLLANPPGLGKTAVGIRTIQALNSIGEDPFPVIVICPNSLKITVWAEEIKKWAPGYTVSVIDGPATRRRKQLAEKTHFYVINWESVRLHSRLARYGTIAMSDADKAPKELNELQPRTVIMDEAHRLAHPRDSKQARAAWAVAHQAEFRYALTGTPVADHVGDLWGLLHGIDPFSFAAKTKYLDRYALVSLNLFGGMEVEGLNPATEEEFRSITNPYWRRVPKEVALPMLPPKLPTQYRLTPMTPSQAKLYRQMEEEAFAQVESGELITAVGHLPMLTRLLQFAAASAGVDMDGHVKLSTPSAKVDDLLELLEELGDDPLVVAAVSRQLIELAAAKLVERKISHGLITGAQSVEERAQAVRQFQEGRLRVILLTLGAGSEGITLTRADTILFMQRSFRVIENEQAEARVHRIGSEGHEYIRVIEQITPGTVEENKRSLLAGKESRIEEIIRDKDTLRRLLGK